MSTIERDVKPWQEKWEWHKRGGGGARLYSDNHEEEWATTWGDDNNARAQLAAAAPDMARLLDRILSLRDSEDAGDVAMAICVEWPEMEAVLRKAGVLP